MLVDANTQVEGGTKLVRLKPDAEPPGRRTAGVRADLCALLDTATADRGRPGRGGRRAGGAALAGAGLLHRRAGGALADGRPGFGPAELPADDPGLLAGEIEVLQIFADLCVLSRNRRMPDGDDGDEEPL